MTRLCIKEVAERQGWCLAQIQREARLSIMTARRYWYNSRTGLACDEGTLTQVNLAILGTIAALLRVQPGELLAENETVESAAGGVAHTASGVVSLLRAVRAEEANWWNNTSSRYRS